MDPGPLAAKARGRLARLASRALSSGRWNLRLEGDSPSERPCVYVTAHLGSLQALRYALRARGIPAATILGPHNLDRRSAAAQDRVFDRRYPLDFPHAFASSQVHRLRGALKRGSLVAAADLPRREGSARRCSAAGFGSTRGLFAWRARPAYRVGRRSRRCRAGDGP